MQCTSFQLFQLAWDGQAFARQSQPNMFLQHRLHAKSSISYFSLQRFSSQKLQQKHGFKALCHVGCFLPDHKFCYIIQQLEQNMFLQGCGKYLDGSSKQFHFSSYMTYVNTTKEYIRVGDNHGPLSSDWQSQSTKATLLLLYPVCYIAKPWQTQLK